MSSAVETLVLTASDVVRCLAPAECRAAVTRAFELLGSGATGPPKALGFESRGGGFHVKAAAFAADRPRFVAKVNGNFPGNPLDRNLPTIQGVLVLADFSDGRPLAVMDTASVTAIRTAAASAVAIERLARPGSAVAAIIGCGLQGAAHVDALLALQRFRELRLHDVDPAAAERLARRAEALGVAARVVRSAAEAAREADVVVTCTTGSEFVLGEHDVVAGALVAAVGADHPRKREIHPALMKAARVVVDDLDQCAACGDLHHAIEAGTMTPQDVHASLAAVVAGTTRGRSHDHDRIVFDSTGIAIEDAAAADIAYERACALGLGHRVQLGA